MVFSKVLQLFNGKYKEGIAALNEAYGILKRTDLHGATRVTILLMEAYLRQQQHHAAVEKLVNCASEPKQTELRAALLIEQAALCWLKRDPPYWRKAGFKFVLAGFRWAVHTARPPPPPSRTTLTGHLDPQVQQV